MATLDLQRVPNGCEIEHGILVQPGRAASILYWRMLKGAGYTLAVRPLLSGRDYHAMHHENPAFNFTPEIGDQRVVFHPYGGVPSVAFHSSAAYSHQPQWYRNFLYTREQGRGLDSIEDLASPGVFRWDLSKGEGDPGPSRRKACRSAEVAGIRDDERLRRAKFSSRLQRAGDAYIVKRRAGKTIIAGYPWFTDWGRDTFISIRGLCLATGRLDDARAILLEWSGAVSEGMLPNRFPDYGEAPEYNAVDASLWYVIAVFELFVRETENHRPRTRATSVCVGGTRSSKAASTEGHPLPDSLARCRRAAGGGSRAGRTADLDGCENRRLGGHARASWQAG